MPLFYAKKWHTLLPATTTAATIRKIMAMASNNE